MDTPIVPCRCCGETLDAKYQPPIVPGKPGFHYLTCWNKDCQLSEQTFTDKSYLTVDISPYCEQTALDNL